LFMSTEGDEADSKNRPLLNSPAGLDKKELPLLTSPTKPPPERFLVLLLFSLMALSQATAWNFYGPISGPTKDVYGWSDGTIAWLANTANIAMVFSIPVSSWLANSVGLRGATAGCGCLCVICGVLRLLPLWLHLDLKGSAALGLNFLSMISNGLSAAWLNFGGPVVSSSYFPPEERGTATAVGSLVCYAGVALGYIFGPLCVGEKGSVHQKSVEIATLQHCEALYAVIVALAVITWFPRAPSSCPSASAASGGGKGAGAEQHVAEQHVAEQHVAEHHEDYAGGTTGTKTQVAQCTVWCTPKARRLWVVAVAAALPIGAFGKLLYTSPILLSYTPLLSSSPLLLSYTPLMHTSHAPLSYTPLIHSSHTLLSCTPLLYSSPILLSYTPLIHSSPTLLSYTPLIHTSHTHLSYTPLIHSSPTLLSYTPLPHSSSTLLSYRQELGGVY
jgi:MFS family permease